MMYGTVGLLVSSAVGYIILERAETHKKGTLRWVGQILGWVILLSSLLGILVCRGWCPFAKRGAMKGMCPLFSTPTAPSSDSLTAP